MAVDTDATPEPKTGKVSHRAASTYTDADLHPLLEALIAVRDGSFRTRLDPPAQGMIAELSMVFNQIMERKQHFSDEFARVHREVARTGHLDERLEPGMGQGGWASIIQLANSLLDSMYVPLMETARVVDAVADGDLSQRADLQVGNRPLRGDLRRPGKAVNRMVDQLSLFTSELTQVAHEVGTAGRLGGRARVRGMSGRWREVTTAVNTMASRLTAQVRDISVVTTGVAKGDLTRKVTVEAAGELLELKLTVNTMVDQLSAFADEVTRVAREVGTEGRLDGQAQVRGVSGVWKDLTDNVNGMARNLTYQVRNIAQVATAVAQGDLGKKITVEAQGEILQLKDTINTMVDQLSAFADEVTRVAREVGTEGRLGGQAQVRGVSGVWKDLTDNVNSMADNLTYQVRNIAQITTAVAQGDLSKTITVDARGEILELKDTINTMVDQLSAFADEVTRVAREVGTEGRLGGQAQVRGVSGVWKDLTDNVNSMADNLTNQVRNIAQVATTVAQGNLSKKIDVDARGEILQLKTTINTMVDQLSAFADEVTRVAREVGTEGRLGGQAQVRGVSGVWKDLTDNVNSMADNLTNQVRNIAQITTAVANGDLSKKIDVDARGEILQLKTTINTMVDQLSSFASEVTRVAREVGSEGRLGGQAEVEGVSGTWKLLTERVNELASNLTTQVRAIAEVASAVASGDLNRQIDVKARGEVAALKDNVNLMVTNLRETTRAKDWLESNLARIAALMQGHRDLVEVADLILSELTPLVAAQYGAFFLAESNSGTATEFALIAGYGYGAGGTGVQRVFLGEGLIGQAMVEKRRILIADAPPDYIKIQSGIGGASATHVVVLPILFEDNVLGVIELASFSPFSDVHLAFFDQFVHTIGVAINTIITNARTESLLAESQRLTRELQVRSDELQRQQAELRRSNAELEEKAALLAEQNSAIEVQNFEIEQARRALEERAEQLSLSSQYKSEFLANMSHELRTPLNSMLILAKLLSDNSEGNLTPKQVEFSETIHRGGTDLQQLIDDILDLSKVEAGKMDVHPQDLPLDGIVEYVQAAFRPLAVEKGLSFSVTVAPATRTRLFADEQRLQQILRNLLSNAIKFTPAGEVRLRIRPAGDVTFLNAGLHAASDVIAFAITDTGVGIPADKLRVIFEEFQQADGTTNRKYGGTGLGLSISRKIASLLGGEIHAQSEPDVGSTFTLYLPATYAGPVPADKTPADGIAAVLAAATEAVKDRATAEPTGRVTATPSTAPPALPTTSPGPSRSPTTPTTPTSPTALPSEILSTAIEEIFARAKVLIVDDDIRNVFALTSALERHGVEVVYAENGKTGIEQLRGTDNVSLVLMDVMMPEMDGYATMRAIREMPQFANLPIIALTAKVMKADRERCLAAGASDYVPKPVDVDHLLAVMRRWLDR